MSSSLSFYGGWAGIAVVGAGYWYLQNRKPAVKQTKAAPTKQATKQTEARKDTKSKKQRSEGAQSSGDQASEKSTSKKARKSVKIDAKPPVQNITSQPTTSTSNDDDDEIDNREFARQLSNAKAGTVIGSKPQAGARQKSVKQSRAQAAASNSFDENTASASSSNAGADADDDMSAANSPVLNAKSSNLGGVGDMLEPASQGPSVLRITTPTNPQPKKEKKAAKAPEPTETKKQRQNRKKREAEKLALDASEQDRKVLLESQRRTAREAEGRAAKDGSQYTNAAASASVWKADKAAETKPANGQVELLDTYEPATKPVAAKPKAKGSEDYATLPSEEEQLRLIEEDSAWNTVTKPKKGKKKADEAVKPVEAPTPAPYVPETKLPKQRTVEGNWVDNSDHGVTERDLADDNWEVA
ncbi:hypothetical protein V493_07048 [Pseudogymnoascus sp. VKM F-4281 (FW-2241)]|nr:hypothetical protein V493_07048 [Pseudogymnoascus sp. VKM F-4281 (FW-2241)]